MRNSNHYKGKAALAFTEGDDGLVGHPKGADTNSEGYSKLQEMIRASSAELTAEEKREIEFNAIRYRMMG